MRKYIFILLLLPMIVSCQKKIPKQNDILQYIKENPLSFTESYIITKNLIQNYKSLDGETSKAIIPIKASVKATINLTDIHHIQFNEEKHIAKIVLPPPSIKITMIKTPINNALYCTNVSRSTYFETDTKDYYPQAIDLIKEDLAKSNISIQVQRNAALALAYMLQKQQLRNINYQIEITKYNTEDILNFITK